MAPIQKILDDLAEKNVIVFDGECVLCNRFFQFIVKVDRKQQFHFIIAQSSIGESLYEHFGLKKGDYDTSLVLVNGQLYERMRGFYKAMRMIGMPWSLLSVFGLLPDFVNDFMYYRIARNRYQIFGRQEFCLVPDEQIKSRFID